MCCLLIKGVTTITTPYATKLYMCFVIFIIACGSSVRHSTDLSAHLFILLVILPTRLSYLYDMKPKCTSLHVKRQCQIQKSPPFFTG